MIVYWPHVNLYLNKNKDEEEISLQMQSGVAHLSQALGASPITFGDIVEGWDQTVGVITVVTPITKQESIFITSTLAYQAYVLLNLWGKNKNCHKRMDCTLPVMWKSNGPLTSPLIFHLQLVARWVLLSHALEFCLLKEMYKVNKFAIKMPHCIEINIWKYTTIQKFGVGKIFLNVSK